MSWDLIKKKGLSLLPSELNPEKGFALATAGMLTLMVAADFEFEREEFAQACSYLQNNAILVNAGITQNALDYFKEYVGCINEVLDEGDYRYELVKADIMEDIKKVPERYKSDLLLILTELRSIAQGDELKMAEDIQSALS